jgi:hypothetical protein
MWLIVFSFGGMLHAPMSALCAYKAGLKTHRDKGNINLLANSDLVAVFQPDLSTLPRQGCIIDVKSKTVGSFLSFCLFLPC